MVKKAIAVVLILLAGGTWFYLDRLNKQELQAAEEMRKAMEQARAKARELAEARAKFEAQLLADLNTCKAEAEKAKADFLEVNKQPVRRKPGQFTIPQSAIDEAAKMLDSANAGCQAIYDTRFRNGA